jgi:hypothetical protein
MWIFLIASIIILVLIVIFMPKNISKIELYTSYFFMLVLSWSINVVIDAKYSLRGFFQKGPDYPTILIYIFLFPCIGVIFINFYNNKQWNKNSKIVYFFFSIIMVLVYDMLLVKFNILHYYNWTYLYSVLLYLIDFLAILVNLKVVKSVK